MMVRLEGVSKRYGIRTVLRDVDLTIQPVTVTVLTGPNGAGKSTLLRLMAGLTDPTTGTVHHADSDPRHLGYLGHATFAYPALSALENLAFWQALYGADTRQATLMDALERVDLAAHAHEKAAVFSRGMAQRLNLARLLLQCPTLWLLDEPETGLDAASCRMLTGEIAAARKHGAGVVWISHQPGTAFPLADRLLELAERRVRYDGPMPAHEAAAC